jgi:hypothetical protein
LPHRFSNLSSEASACAYGGSVIQDLGYFPFGAVALCFGHCQGTEAAEYSLADESYAALLAKLTSINPIR